MNNQAILLITVSTFIFILFSSCAKNGSKEEGHKRIKLSGRGVNKIVNQCLTVQVMDKTLQGDGKVEISYTNTCEDYEFQLTKTGLKYKTLRGKEKYLDRISPIAISSGSTVTLEISIPIGIYPKVAYAFADDVKVYELR